MDDGCADGLAELAGQPRLSGASGTDDRDVLHEDRMEVWA